MILTGVVWIIVYFLCLWVFRLIFTGLLIRLCKSLLDNVKQSLKGEGKA